MHSSLIALLLFSAAISGAAANGVVTYSIPSFNAKTTIEVLGSTNLAVFRFEPGRHLDKFDRTEGFVLLEQQVNIWRFDADEKPPLQASFNTSFRLSGSKPIAFVVLLDSIPLGGNLRGEGNYTAFASANVSGIADVQVGPVMSYFGERDVGLNVTVKPHVAALGVWIEYDAVVHSLSVYIATNGSKSKPSKALIGTPINLFIWPHTTRTAYIGFFAGMLRDVTNGVRDWNLTMDKFPEESVASGKKGTSWPVVLLAVLGSMAVISTT